MIALSTFTEQLAALLTALGLFLAPVVTMFAIVLRRQSRAHERLDSIDRAVNHRPGGAPPMVDDVRAIRRMVQSADDNAADAVELARSTARKVDQLGTLTRGVRDAFSRHLAWHQTKTEEPPSGG